MAYRLFEQGEVPDSLKTVLEGIGRKEDDFVVTSVIPEAAHMKELLDPDQRIIEVIVSSDRVDREGDIIDQDGIDHQWAKSVLYAHDYGGKYLPIGKIVGARTEKRKGIGTVTIQKHQFPAPGAYALADAAWNLIMFGSLNATSVGFIPQLIKIPESDDEREKMGLGRFGRFFEKIELIETSWVPVPANRDAVRDAYGKGVIDREQVSILFPGSSDQEIVLPKQWSGFSPEPETEVTTVPDPDPGPEVTMIAGDPADVMKAVAEILARLTVIESKMPDPPAGSVIDIERDDDPGSVELDDMELGELLKEVCDEITANEIPAIMGLIQEKTRQAIEDVTADVARQVVQDRLGIIDPTTLNFKRR